VGLIGAWASTHQPRQPHLKRWFQRSIAHFV